MPLQSVNTRRSPPTSLRLVTGPLPMRGKPRHTLPSIPRPAFNPTTHVVRTGPAPRPRATTPELPELAERLPHNGASSPTSSMSSHGGRSRSPSPERARPRMHSRASSTSSISSVASSRSRSDHTRSISLPFDVATLLAPLQPAAINPVSVW